MINLCHILRLNIITLFVILHFLMTSNAHMPSFMQLSVGRPSILNDAKTGYNLFYIERSGNANRIYYDIRLNTSGQPDNANPIVFYRVKPGQHSHKLELSWFEKQFAYGLKFISSGKDQFIFRFAAYSGRNFNLHKNKQGIFRVYTNSLGAQVEVYKLYIHITGGTLLVPTISKIDLYGKDPVSGKNTFESIPI